MGVRTRGYDIAGSLRASAADKASQDEARRVVERWNAALAAGDRHPVPRLGPNAGLLSVRVDDARNSAHAQIMDELAEGLLLAVLREHGKSLVDIRQEVRTHIADFERLVRNAALPDPNDPYKCERAVQELRVRFRLRVEREASQANNYTATLQQALQILEEDRSTGLWPME